LGDHTKNIHDPDNAWECNQGEVQRYENNYKSFNLITTALGRYAYDHVSHLTTTYDIWFKFCNTYECSFKIKSSHNHTYNRQY
jgi:hypothetical protein